MERLIKQNVVVSGCVCVEMFKEEAARPGPPSELPFLENSGCLWPRFDDCQFKRFH